MVGTVPSGKVYKKTMDNHQAMGKLTNFRLGHKLNSYVTNYQKVPQVNWFLKWLPSGKLT